MLDLLREKAEFDRQSTDFIKAMLRFLRTNSAQCPSCGLKATAEGVCNSKGPDTHPAAVEPQVEKARQRGWRVLPKP